MSESTTAAHRPADEPGSPQQQQKKDAALERLRKASEGPALDARLEEAELQVRQMDEKALLADYDAAYVEHERQTKRVGKHIIFERQRFEVPPVMPASFGIFYVRHCLKPQKGGRFEFTIPDQMVHKFFTVLLGPKFADAVSKSKKAMPWVVQHVVADVLQFWGLALGESPSSAGGASAEGNESTRA